MGKFAEDATIDSMLDILENSVVKLSIVTDTATPTDVSNEIAAIAVADTDMTNAAGDVSGRKLTVGAQSSVGVNSDGVAHHLVMTSSGDVLKYITTVSSQQLAQGGSVSIPAFDIEILDPT